MTDTTGVLRLMSWLSPVFPTGGFAYSSGLEAAVQTRIVTNESELEEWLSTQLQHGTLRNDALLLADAFGNCDDIEALNETAHLATALAGSAVRYLESTAQGDAFVQAVRSWPQLSDIAFPEPCPLTVAIGMAAGRSGINLQHTLNAYLQSFITNQVQAAIRLSVIGQAAAARLLAALELEVLTTAETSKSASLDDLGSATIMADTLTMKHEELSGRLFRS